MFVVHIGDYAFDIAGDSWEALQDGLTKSGSGGVVVGELEGVVEGVMTEATAQEVIDILSAVDESHGEIKH